jgi:hypothetical protein
VPFVFIQLIMVAIVIAFPRLVLVSLDSGPKIDPSKVKIEAPSLDQGGGGQPFIPQIK